MRKAEGSRPLREVIEVRLVRIGVRNNIVLIVLRFLNGKKLDGSYTQACQIACLEWLFPQAGSYRTGLRSVGGK